MQSNSKHNSLLDIYHRPRQAASPCGVGNTVIQSAYAGATLIKWANHSIVEGGTVFGSHLL